MPKSTRVFVCAVVQDKEGKFLLLKRSDDSRFAPGEWELVSGSLVENETAEECIVRELKEETNIDVTVLKKLPVFEVKDKDGYWVVLPYRVKWQPTEIIISDEHTNFGWFTQTEATTFPYMKDMLHLFR